MHARTLVVVSCLAFAFVLVGSRAAAQQPSPPDVVFEPLVTQAEAERAAHPDLALAHAEAALRFAPTGSALAVRAQAVLAATAPPPGSPPSGSPAATPPSEDTIWEPLVTAAEGDAAAGRRDLALDRLSAVMRTVAPAGALATRARNLYAIVSGGAPPPPPGGLGQPAPPGQGAAEQLAPPPTPTTPPPYGPPPVYGAPPVYGQPYGPGPYAPVPYGNPGYRLALPPRGDPTLRSTGEFVLSLIAVGSFGGYVGGWLSYAAGADPSTGAIGAYYIVPVLTAAALVGGMFGLDQINGGMRNGQPNAITTGLLTGTFIGMLTMGYVDNVPCSYSPYPPYTSYGCPTGLTNVTTVGVGATLGLGVGLLYAYAVKPTLSATTLTESAMLWGMYFGGMVTLMDNANLRGDQQSGWFGPIIGTAAGALIGAVLGQTIRPSGTRVGLLWAGFAAGVLAGGLIPLSLSGSSSSDAGWAGVSLALGATAGLAIVAVLTGSMREDPAAPSQPLPVTLGASPLPTGGAIVTASGRF